MRHEFLLRRLHSLSGLIPVGAYMIVHLLTNSLTMMGTAPFQNAVYQIHALGPALPLVEWGFIFIPILFHAIFGVVIIFTGRSNVAHHGYCRQLSLRAATHHRHDRVGVHLPARVSSPWLVPFRCLVGVGQ
ncbi:MAG: hypothetical protein R3B96_05215 [Pirellulaceae bacterium]